MANEKTFRTKLIEATTKVASLMVVWLGIIIVLRVFEILLSGYTKGVPESLFKLISISLLFDFIFWLRLWFLAYLIYIAFYMLNPRLARGVLVALISLLTLGQLMLISYFNTALVPLGADIFGYSIADIKQTVGASSGINLFSIVGFVVIIALWVLAIIYLPKRIKIPLLLCLVFPLLSLTNSVFNLDSFKNRIALPNEYENNLSLNKTDYFISSSWNYFNPVKTDVDIYSDAYIDYFEGSEKSREAFVFPDESNYPFYHTNETPDVLSPFFTSFETKPNVVVLLVEGLGRAFTNEGAYLGNFTPFIDSLSVKSLYWKNFLSNGGRTFAVLPSVMASMPYASNGMLEMGERMPEHLSLYSLLKHNGYQTSFYYGGDSAFDNMGIFLKRNKVDEIGDLNSIPKTYRKLPSSANGFSWGYADDQLLSYTLSRLAVKGNQKPQFNTILTVATHDPFLIANQAHYVKMFEARMNTLGFDEAKKANYRKFSPQYASILYVDESIRNFFKSYEKREDYKETIFIITGDHRMAEIPLRSKIDRFHVPLIIYSPLLKRTAQFESVSSHIDIAPSLLAMLKNQLKLDLPVGGSWMGDGLDTARNFRNIHSYPLIQTKTAMVDFIQGDYHLNLNQLYKLTSDLDEIPVQQADEFNLLQNGFNKFKVKNDKITAGGKLLPKQILDAYRLK